MVLVYKILYSNFQTPVIFCNKKCIFNISKVCIAQNMLTVFQRSMKHRRLCTSFPICMVRIAFHQSVTLSRLRCNTVKINNNNGILARNYTIEKPTTPSCDNNEKKPGILQRFKIAYKKYWFVVLPVHLVTSSVWFGSFYLISSSGIDIPALLDSIGLPAWISEKLKNGHSFTGHLVISYALYKLFTPIRYMVTLGGTGITIRYLQKFGYMAKNVKKK
ncbi:uncharacterized protein LOC126838829 [Adelges cooleyi]|uniref:uncharacterized protein LOC126838829 n=1 Tax=Adelges cooleyi TaxID=133065 RepID=UPI00217F3F0B|nr:uncharacterized protein LOC126838829 [Adelges cooleyi]